MPDFILESRVWLPKPRADIFPFFSDPANLVRISPPRFRVALLTPGATMRPGAAFDYRMTWLGVPIRWRTFIREFDPPVRIVDVQVRGPYARWEHRHLFLEERGGTWVEDRVTYRLPFGPVGRLAHALVVGRQLAGIWAYRRARLAELVAPVFDAPP